MSGLWPLAFSESPDSMKYFEVEESESYERQDAGEEEPAVIDIISRRELSCFQRPDILISDYLIYCGLSLSSVISKLILSSWVFSSSSKEEKLLASEKSISKKISYWLNYCYLYILLYIVLYHPLIVNPVLTIIMPLL